ncbi:unnamed protein product, partial [Discosporangium mesarthrocarpum]
AFDFGYSGGVHTTPVANNSDEINHDVEVTGWGVTEDGVKFWQARNSWGTYWGEQGFFKIQRGINLNSFESECYFAIPDVREENLVSTGVLTGSMYGLESKQPEAAAEGVNFLRSLHSLDWSSIAVPMALQEAGIESFASSSISGGGGGGGRSREGPGPEGSLTRALTLLIGAVGGAVLCYGAMVARIPVGGRRAGYAGIGEGGAGGAVVVLG